jgi:hypothetical protein
MKQDYKDTFDLINIRKDAYLQLRKIPGHKEARTISRRLRLPRLAYIMMLCLCISLPVATVYAAVKIDIFAVFGSLFGAKAELLQDHASLPEVKVLKNTFEDIDIAVTGITGDQNLIYIGLELTDKSQNIFTEGDFEFETTSLILEESSKFIYIPDKADENIVHEPIEGTFSQSMADFLLPIPDTDLTDHKKAFAYIVDQETVINGQKYFIPGETYLLKLNNLISDSRVVEGSWEAEFVADYSEAASVTLKVDRIARMPLWGSDDSFADSDIDIETITISPLALRYTGAYDYTFGNADIWERIYIEFKDGSTYGYRTFDDLLERLLKGERRMMSGDWTKGEPYLRRWIFGQPIDLSQVKAIHLGNITVEYPASE